MPGDSSRHRDAPSAGSDARQSRRDDTAAEETEPFQPSPGEGPAEAPFEPDTAQAPSFPPPTPGPTADRTGATRGALATLPPGSRLADFEVLDVLGRGAFGVVYLARQLSLDRQVALKVAANVGSEGRTMARLEHRHIVQVFSEVLDDSGTQRLLCMQFVCGTSLEEVIGTLNEMVDPRDQWDGQDVLNVVDRAGRLESAVDPAALQDREALARMDCVEATAWLGGRLAEALDYAHRRQVLHRDIKPANILVNRYGHPLLADFNIAFRNEGDVGDESFGGTLAYMSPEHLDAFNPSRPTTAAAVTEQSDIYSLGLVLHELWLGSTPFPGARQPGNVIERASRLADERRSRHVRLTPGAPDPPKVLGYALGRCLEPAPAARFASGAELADTLAGCRQFCQAHRDLPKLESLVRPLLRHPFLWIVVLSLVPQIISSIVNISYNQEQITRHLSLPQQQCFHRLVIGYNLAAYPLLALVLCWLVVPVWRTFQAVCGTAPVPTTQIDQARRSALSLPVWAAILSAFGWIPGGLLFPTVIDWVAGPLERTFFVHFAISFTLSGLIALAYTLCAVQFVVLWGLYPRMWGDVRGFRARARQELAGMSLRHSVIQTLALWIPSIAVVLLLATFGAESNTMGFRSMLIGLIVAGGVGIHIAATVTRRLAETLVALTGSEK